MKSKVIEIYWHHSKVRVTILNRADFRARKIIRDKEEHYTMTIKTNSQEDIIFLNVYMSNNRVSNT